MLHVRWWWNILDHMPAKANPSYFSSSPGKCVNHLKSIRTYKRTHTHIYVAASMTEQLRGFGEMFRVLRSDELEDKGGIPLGIPFLRFPMQYLKFPALCLCLPPFLLSWFLFPSSLLESILQNPDQMPLLNLPSSLKSEVFAASTEYS